MASLRDLAGRVKQLFSNAGSNLGAWKQVATTPQLRQDYSRYVVQPTVQKIQQYAKPVLLQQYSPKAQVKAQINKIGSMGVFPESNEINAPYVPIREYLKPKSYLGGPAGKSISSLGEMAIGAFAPQVGGVAQTGKVAFSLPQALKSGTALSSIPLAMNLLRGEKTQAKEIVPTFILGAATGSLKARQIKAKEILKSEPEIEDILSKVNRYNWLKPEQQMDTIGDIERIALKVVPEIVKSKEMKDMRRVDLEQWMNLTARFIQDKWVSAKNPELNFPLRIRELKSKPIAQISKEQLVRQGQQQLSRGVAQKMKGAQDIGVGVQTTPLKIPVETLQKGISSTEIIPQTGKYAENINLERLKLNPEERQILKTTVDVVKPELEKIKGKTLSHKEVVDAARKSVELTNVSTREETLAAEAAVLKARQKMVSLDKEIGELAKSGNTKALELRTKELVESLRVTSSTAADWGRKLESLKNEAGDVSIRQQLLKEIAKVESNTNTIAQEAAKVDWNNSNSITSFYRKFIKPSTMEVLDEYRYNNMLANPRTHIRNAFSNLVQTFITRPGTLAFSGKPTEATKYYSGALKSFPDATNAFMESFKGTTPIAKPDISQIGTKKLPGFLTVPTRLMEAADKFFSALIKGGELARGATPEQAGRVAEYSLFRQGLRPEGQGKLLNGIDSITAWTYQAPKAVRWFVPFIRTPMNFAKQWIEYSPAGVATLPGSANKREQLGKALLGSTITALGAKFALDGNTTWDTPTDPKQKELFYASGKKPFSVKIGDKWVSMMYAGPFATAFAMPAAMKYYQDESRTALTDSQLEKATQAVAGMARFLSGQTFLEGINNFVRFASGDVDYSLPGNLAFSAGQVIPLEGLVRWVSTIVDPIYRKGTSFTEGLQKNLPFLSKGLEPYTTPEGQPSRREPQNYFTPYDITTSNPQYDQMYQQRTSKLQSNAVENQIKKELEREQGSVSPKVGKQETLYNIDGVDYSGKAVNGKFIYWDPESASVKSPTVKVLEQKQLTKEKQLLDAQYSLASDQMKRTDDSYSWLDLTKNYIDYLKEYKTKIGDEASKLTVQNKIEDLQAQVDKYASYGGFKKAKKPAKISARKIPLPKIAEIKTKTTNIKIKAPPKPKKITVSKNKTIAKNVVYKIKKPAKIKMAIAKKGFLG